MKPLLDKLFGLSIFNPPGSWMERINPSLLERYWDKKGRPGIFVYIEDGMKIAVIPTMYGTMRMGYDCTLTWPEKLTTYQKEPTCSPFPVG